MDEMLQINLSPDLIVKWAEDLLLYTEKWETITIYELPDKTWNLIAYR
ncbi:MAG: hypothetical protein ACFFC7_27695 [Candidatus Hermodarchaeota archaeon]